MVTLREEASKQFLTVNHTLYKRIDNFTVFFSPCHPSFLPPDRGLHSGSDPETKYIDNL